MTASRSFGGKPLLGRRVFVTGATGNLGRVLCRTLSERGASVVASVRPSSPIEDLKGPRISIAHAPIFDTARLTGTMAGCDTVVHCAGITGRRFSSATEMWHVNADGPAAVWRAACSAGMRRFILVSSSGVYGRLRHWPADETTPVLPDTFYRRSKLAGEQKVRALASSQRGPAWLFVRPTSLIGPGLGGWSSVVTSLLRGRVWVVGDGSHPTHLTHVNDAAEGLADAVAEEEVEGTVVNLGASTWQPLRTFLELMAEQVGVDVDRAVRRLPAWPLQACVAGMQRAWGRLRPEPAALTALAFISQPRAYSIDRARRLLGFTPRLTLREAVSLTFAHAANAGLASSDAILQAGRRRSI